MPATPTIPVSSIRVRCANGNSAEEMQQERVRLSNRIRQQLWRYYPQLLEVSDDVTAEWVLDLWTLAPTPAKAARLREATLARLLQRHRIRRVDAERALGLLRQSAIKVAEGVTEAAVLHLRSLVARLRLASSIRPSASWMSCAQA